ncbi:MAG: LON peptidase substrate-binding domain-containing protein [Candidatus Rokubacteria bacterium]|nr:LON peptidase substrate-binding domain-containing protein [Candidatus Rokubacteria bacterium]
MSLRVPIFPLPNTVFFPHTTLPLHIFEPRYRQMVADRVAGDKCLAVVLLKPGWEADYYGRPPVCRVAGAGEITQWERLPDGRYNILLRGTGRIVIEGEVRAEKLYRIAAARWLEDAYPAGGERELAPQLEPLRLAFGQLLSGLSRPIPKLLDVLTDRDSPAAVVDRIAAAVVGEAELRQRLLEEPNVEARIGEVTRYLRTLLAARGERDPRWQAKWN